MKIFRKEKGKEVVYVQGKDLALISKIDHLSRNVDIDISIDSLLIKNCEKFTRIDDERMIEMLKHMYFIVDYDEFSKLSEQELYDKSEENRLEMDKLSVIIRRLKKDAATPYRQAYITRDSYAYDISKCIEFKKTKKVPIYENKN